MGTFRIQNWIKYIDVFSFPIPFAKAKLTPYKTLLGGILTILIVIFMVIYFSVLVTNPWSIEKSDANRRLNSQSRGENYDTK